MLNKHSDTCKPSCSSQNLKFNKLCTKNFFVSIFNSTIILNTRINNYEA